MAGAAGDDAERGAGDVYVKVPSFSRAGVAGVQVAVVAHLEPSGPQRLAQRRFDGGGIDEAAHRRRYARAEGYFVRGNLLQCGLA